MAIATRPSTYSQSSRKSKRSWRKNVDLTTLESALEIARDETIQTGGLLLADTDSDALFQTDTAGSTAIQNAYHKEHKPLRADEILAERSKVPAVDTRKRAASRVTDGVMEESGKRRKGAWVSHKELERLKKVAFGGVMAQAEVMQPTEAAKHDLWAIAETETSNVDAAQSFLEPRRPAREPSTLKQPPKPLTADGCAVPSIAVPSAGRSYNPTFDSWSSLLEREGAKEVAAETQRQGAEKAEVARLARAAAIAEEVERKELETEAQERQLGDEESEWDGCQSDVDVRLKRPTRKTPAERNKAKRRKVAERLAKHNSRTRAKEEQAKQLAAIHAESKRKGRANAVREVDADSTSESDDSSSTPQLRRRLPAAMPPSMLELTLPDELADSLRRLQPEGNLLRDRFRSAVVQGKVEARKRVGQAKKPKRTVTEKWSYKDWRLVRGTGVEV